MKRTMIFAILTSLVFSANTGFAQKVEKVWKIGYLASSPSNLPHFREAFRQRLSELGYVDGQNIQIIARYHEGDAGRFPALIAELVQQNVHLIVTQNAPATQAAKVGAPGTPIVFVGVGDPVRSKFVNSVARPGGNITGFSLLTPELTPKRLQLLKETVPTLSRVAVLWNPETEIHAQELQSLETVSRALEVRLLPIAVRRPEELPAAFAAMTIERANGLIVLAAPLHHTQLTNIANLAREHRLPAICEFTEFGGAGGLIVYGASYPEMLRGAAGYVVKILNGVNPGELPIQQPTKLEFAINLKTAKALGIAIPDSILARADEVIE